MWSITSWIQGTHSALLETEASETKPSQGHFVNRMKNSSEANRLSFQKQHQTSQDDCNGGTSTNQHSLWNAVPVTRCLQVGTCRTRMDALHLNTPNRLFLQFHMVYIHKALCDHRKIFLFLPQHICLLWWETMWSSFWSPSRSLKQLAHVPAFSFTMTCGFVENTTSITFLFYPKWPMASRIQHI